MKIKESLINSVIIFILCSIIHFLYDWFPNFFTSLIAPVNESTFEHLKMIFTAAFIFTIISYGFRKDNNLFLRLYLRAMLDIIILLALYLPFSYFFGEIMIATLIILFISLFITEIILNLIPLKKPYLYLNILSALLIIINYGVFVYFTYKPLDHSFFYDKVHKVKGIPLNK